MVQNSDLPELSRDFYMRTIIYYLISIKMLRLNYDPDITVLYNHYLFIHSSFILIHIGLAPL